VRRVVVGVLVGSLVACSESSGGTTDPERLDAADAQVDAAADGAVDAGSVDASMPHDAADDVGREASLDASDATYVNPVVAHDFPDPFVLRVDQSYYAFATNAFGSNIQVATSSDLATWTDLPDALPNLPSWAAANAGLTWAPSVLARSGTFVLFYTARDNASGFQCVSRAVSTTPMGPYVDTSSAPLICQTAICGSIDPSPFVDDDGSAYLVWKSDENNPTCGTPPRIWSQPLTSDGISVLGSPTVLLERDQLWEGAVIEGPAMWKSGGAYYLFYSANRYDSADYAVGYGVCQGAIGPCEKKTLDPSDGGGSPAILQSAGSALGPGGEQLFQDTGLSLWVVYHAWTAPETSYSGDGARSMRIDRVTFDAGQPIILGPTTTPQPL
jgi:beta-xylosidase